MKIFFLRRIFKTLRKTNKTSIFDGSCLHSHRFGPHLRSAQLPKTWTGLGKWTILLSNFYGKPPLQQGDTFL